MSVREEPSASPLAIALLGAFDARLEGAPLPLRSRKTEWLLALLVLQHGRAVERGWLAGTLWPDSAEEQAAFNLRHNLWYLRRALGPESRRLQAPTGQTLRLELVGAEADVLRFDEAVARGDASSLEHAVALHRGPLLPGCSEPWVLVEREAREQAYLSALERLAAHAAVQGSPAEAARYLRCVIAADPYSESAHRALMQALAATGDFAAVTRLFRDLRHRLHHELNSAPDPLTTVLYEQIRAAARTRTDGVQGCRGAGETATQDNRRGAPVANSPLHPYTPSPLQPPRRLPRPLTRLVGRQAEVLAVRERLADGPLVTLTGPGGIGKTRLAIAVAEDCARECADGVWFVDLSGLSDAALVPVAVAAALEVREQPGQTLLSALQEALSPRQLLLVLDNCEHVIESCAALAQALLSAAPSLRLLATSRQLLGLTGEIVRPVPPLSLPVAGVGGWGSGVGGTNQATHLGAPSLPDPRPLTPDPLLRSDAVALFVERARESTPAFELTEQNAAAVAQICRRLDGIPLAIELAAARTRALTVAEIAARLDDRFRALASGSRTAPPRQQTLQATLDWSYDLLSDPEQVLLQRLSVFAGGWTLEAAEAVCGNFGFRISDFGSEGSEHRPSEDRVRSEIRNPKSEIRNLEVLDLLTQLIDKSLVQVVRASDEGEESRYRLLETTREYAALRLRESQEESATRKRHRDWYLRFVERAEPELRRRDAAPWFKRLHADYNNLRAALDWCLEESGRDGQANGPPGDSTAGHPGPTLPAGLEAGLRLAAALGYFWWFFGPIGERRERVTELLTRVGSVPPGRSTPQFERAWARVLQNAGRFAAADRDCESACDYFNASLEIVRRLRDQELEVSTLIGLGLTLSHKGSFLRARERYEEALSLARAIRFERGMAMALNNLGTIACTLEEPTAARRYFEESIVLQRSFGDPAGISLATSNLGGVLAELGDLEAAERCFLESLALERELEGTAGVFSQLANLGVTALRRGDCARAQSWFCEYRDRACGLADWAQEAEWLNYLGAVCLGAGHPSAARPFLEESLTISRQRADGAYVASALRLLGRLVTLEGDVAAARGCYTESLRWFQTEAPARCRDQIALVEALAQLDAETGQPQRAARLFGAVEAQREALDLPREVCYRAEYERGVARARAALPPPVFDVAWTAGRALSLSESVAFALG